MSADPGETFVHTKILRFITTLVGVPIDDCTQPDILAERPPLTRIGRLAAPALPGQYIRKFSYANSTAHIHHHIEPLFVSDGRDEADVRSQPLRNISVSDKLRPARFSAQYTRPVQINIVEFKTFNILRSKA
jgi:hypothetical protein